MRLVVEETLCCRRGSDSKSPLELISWQTKREAFDQSRLKLGYLWQSTEAVLTRLLPPTPFAQEGRCMRSATSRYMHDARRIWSSMSRSI